MKLYYLKVMTKILWFEHMYQPSWNFKAYEDKWGKWDPKKMIDECYRPNALLMKKLGIKINMNITQTMFNFFKENDAMDVLEIYQELAGKGQIEIVGSTAHHILAIQKYSSVLDKEIQMQTRFVKIFFNQSPKIFFPPEMAIDENTESLVEKNGFKGIIVSGGKPNFQTYDTTGIFENKIKIFPHNNICSAQFAFPVNGFTSDNDLDMVFQLLERYQEPVLFAFDHESFGGYNNPHMLKMKERFFQMCVEKGHEFVNFSDLMQHRIYGKVELKATTWVGDYSKWKKMPDREFMIEKAIEKVNKRNGFYIRKWILPSCHLHIDYATTLFWKYCAEAGLL